MPIPLIVGAGPVALAISAKKKENKRKQAAANSFSQKYPLLEDYGTMASSISAAQFELKTINAAPAKTAGAKRVKNRNSQELSKWIGIMKGHLNDLQAGLAPATSTAEIVQVYPNNVTTSAPVLDTTVTPAYVATQESAAPAPAPAATEAPAGDGTSGEGGAAEGGPTTAADTKKGPNWLLIGGIAVGAFLLFNFMKKK